MAKVIGQIQDLFASRYAHQYERVETSPRTASPITWTRGSRIMSRTCLAAIATAILLLLVATIGTTPVHTSEHERLPEESTKQARFLHLAIPASHPDPNLCKVMLSAGILGYPDPVLINWEERFEDPALVDGGSHIGKITGMQRHLWSFPPERDDDLIIMVDGYDIWFQLRPQTLLDRYFQMNRVANERIDKDIGKEVAASNGISQKVVFSCQKRCWPWGRDDSPCYAVPNSTLPEDTYGPDTDHEIDNEENPFIKIRQRFLNSGVAIGTIKAMRDLLDEALVRAKENSNFGSDQQIFAQIFGEQEIYREKIRRESMNLEERMRDPSPRSTLFRDEHMELIKSRNRPLEFGLGVDYASGIGLATVFAEDDTAWLTYSNKSQLRAANQALGIKHGDSRIDDIQEDIISTVPPFWTFQNVGLPRETSWRDVPLFVDVWTGVAPAIIHHNAHRNGLKSLREEWWNRIWFFEHARALQNARIIEPLGPVATSGLETQIRWWKAEDWKGGARKEDSEWIRYDDLCAGTEDEVFRDGQGPWTLPEDH